MKRNLFFCLAALFVFSKIFSQSVPNGGFESWQVNTYENPTFFQTSNYDKKNNNVLPVCAIKTTDAYHGNYAIRLNTVLSGTDVAFAYFANGNPGGNSGSGGIPYNQKPGGVRFHYKSNIIGTDTALLLCFFKKAGVYIGQYFVKISSTQTNYTLMDATFTPSLTQIPDTVIVAAASSNAFLNSGYQVGNSLQVDSITFKGVNSQPANFNGDFEQWQLLTNYKLNGWYTDGVFQRVTDSYSGTYALELQTALPSFGNNQLYPSRANSGTPSQSVTLGGYPFSSTTDTLIFYYKYLPANPVDSARVNLSFKLNGVGVGGNVYLFGIAAAYTKAKIPIFQPGPHDTLLIEIESSKYPTLPSYVGSDLKIDNMYLKSQMIPISNFISPTVGCVGQPVQLTDNSFNMANAWAWIMPGGSPGSSTQQNPVVTYNSIGTKTITMVCSNQFGSGATITKTISINSIPPTVSSSTIKPCGGVGSAVITASGATSYSWSTGATNASVSVNPGVTTAYTVTGTSNGCSSSAIGVVVVPAAPQPSICMVTTDTLNQNNEIYWNKPTYPMLDSMIIYREVITNTYKRIGAVSKNALSYFADTSRSVGPANGDPNISTYRYKIQVRDTCGSYGPKSLWHNTVFFTHTGSTFFWTNNYQIEGPTNPVVTYSLLVCQNPSVSPVYNVVGTTTGNQNQLNDIFYNIYQNTANWRVEAYLGYACNAQRPTVAGKSSPVSRSNVSNNRPAIGIKENSFSKGVKVYPNPAQKFVNVEFEALNTEVEIRLTNTLGQAVYSEKTLGNKSINVSEFSKGIYTLSINSAKGKAVYKIVVE